MWNLIVVQLNSLFQSLTSESAIFFPPYSYMNSINKTAEFKLIYTDWSWKADE